MKAASLFLTLSSLSLCYAVTYTDYLLVTFKGEAYSNGEQLYMGVTSNNNPLSWTMLNNGNPVLTNPVGNKGVRDPWIIRSEDGCKFWILATDLNVYAAGGWGNTIPSSKSILIWESTDLKNWYGPMQQQTVPSSSSYAWAPAAIWDPAKSQYFVVSFAPGEAGTWTSDFINFSTPTILSNIVGQDVCIVQDPSSSKFYYFNTLNDADVTEYVGTSLSGSFSEVATDIGISSTLPKGEGPLVFQSNTDPSTWYLWIDDFSTGQGYKVFQTSNIASGSWTSVSASFGGFVPRHGGVLPITAAERAMLLSGIVNAGSSFTASNPACASVGTTTTTKSGTTTSKQTTTTTGGTCSALYGQCGGIGWSGPTCCSSGTCTVENSYYSQCL